MTKDMTKAGTKAADSGKGGTATSGRAARKTARAAGNQAAKPSAETRKKRSGTVAARQQADRSSRAARQQDKGLAELFEHALGDIYYAEKKIYKALPKMIKAADHPDLAAALTAHREETAGHIETVEAVFELLGKRAKAQKCDAIDGILEESESLLEDFGPSMAADAAIIFSCQAVEHYEITRYGSLCAFAEALGMDEAREHLQSVLEEERAADRALSGLAEDSINAAAADYDEAEAEHEAA